jgi:hypothetical protein
VTISATRVKELNINTIIRRALNLAGLANPQQSTSDPTFAPQREMALDFLETICKETQNVAVIERHVVLQSAVVTAASDTVTLATSAMSMLGKAMFNETGETEQTPVVFIDLDAYHGIPDKTLEGTPAMAYFDRSAAPIIKLWPVPDTSGTLVVQSHILAADVSNSSEHLDFERHWTGYFMWQLAYYLSTASTMPMAGRMQLAAEAEKRLKSATAYSRPLLPTQIRFAHKTGWT